MRTTKPATAFLEGVDACIIFDHFVSYNSGDQWTSVLTDSGTVTIETTYPGGVMLLTASDGSVADNDEAYVGLTAKIFTIAARQPLVFEAQVLTTEANTDDQNTMIGFSSTNAANMLVDDGAGPPSSYTGAVFFKTDGDTVWQCETSKSTTQTTTRLVAGTTYTQDGAILSLSTSWQKLRIEILPKNGITACDVTFQIDGKTVAVHKDVDFSSAAAMSPVFGIKNGGANNEFLRVQYCYASQVIDHQ